MNLDFLKRRHKKDVIELQESSYLCSINDRMFEFGSKESMLSFLQDYSSKNTIFKLAMFRVDLFNLIK